MKGKKSLFKCVHGSFLYGLNTEKSDQDFKGIVLPSKEELLNNSAPTTSYQEKTNSGKQKNTQEDTDTEWFTLKGFFRLCIEGQTVASEMLFCPKNLYVESSPEWEEIITNRDKLLHRGVESFYGYARKQAYKYSVKGSRVTATKLFLDFINSLPPKDRLEKHFAELEAFVLSKQDLRSVDDKPLLTFTSCQGPQGQDVPHVEVCGRRYSFTTTGKYMRERLEATLKDYGQRALIAAGNDGADWKALSHALRVGGQAVELLETGALIFPRPNREYLLKVKLGQIPYPEVEDEIEKYLRKIEDAGKLSNLPASADKQWCEDFNEKLYQKVLRGEYE